MQTTSRGELVGFLELKVGSLAVQVPIRSADPETEGRGPLASFAVEGETCAIVIRGEPSSGPVEKAVQEAAHEAERHLSRKLLN